MTEENPFGFKDHTPFTGFSDELVYGIDAHGASVHITNAVRGLKCGCLCPACEKPLVAKKGQKQTHHFAHHTQGVACSKVAETNAHIWAKEVLDRVKWITLPRVVAKHGGQIVQVQPSRIYRFVSARLEKRLDKIVPDVVLVTASGRELIVEVRVTHACDDEKISKLRAGAVSAIEVNLSRFRTSTDRAAVEEALLKSSTRHWLHNDKQGEHDERFRLRREAEEAERVAAAEEERRQLRLAHEQAVERNEARIAKDARRLVEALRKGQRNAQSLQQGPGTDVTGIFARFPKLTSVDTHAIGFLVPDPVWQARLLEALLAYPAVLRHRGREFTTSMLIELIEDSLDANFRHTIDCDVADRLKQTFPGRLLPEEALSSFLISLQEAGYVLFDYCDEDRDWNVLVNINYLNKIQDRVLKLRDYDSRQAAIRKSVEAIVARLPYRERKSFDVDSWVTARMPLLEGPPEILQIDGAANGSIGLERSLDAIISLFDSNTPIEDMLGLPLDGEIERARSRIRDAQLRAASNRRQKLIDAAQLKLSEDANAWLRSPSKEDEELSCLDYAGHSEGSLYEMLMQLKVAEAERQAQQIAREVAARCLEELRSRAAKVYTPIEVSLFLKGYNRILDAAPMDYCKNRASLEKCAALLPRNKSKRRA